MTGQLPIGTRLGEHADAHLLATKLNRHTFWCGQSGSGKTYALGVLLEQVLLHTRLPMVILDPNSDFVHLNSVRDDAPAAVAGELARRDVRICRRGAEGGEPLHVRFVDMDVPSRAAVMRIDPLADADDFNVMVRHEAQLREAIAGLGLGNDDATGLRASVVTLLRSRPEPEYTRLAVRLENLGIADWDLWAWGNRTLIDIIDEQPDATVVDLGEVAVAEEAQAAALAVLDHLWARRHERIGRLIVIDEAHNLCSPTPATPVQRLLTERIVQIAAEGRKYGLWLLMSTQRPSKVHPNALSQCDNLGLMKMSAPRDLAELGSVFGYAPESLLARATEFGQGEVLFAGGFAPAPMIVQVAPRLTREGGADVPIALR
ncbi:ATP-binding protein [Gordonia iterans]|uniref:ATP-binding protein n=1 Tax=Gordonia iterans TaxID=1004901 RepID=A0A2S0KCA4_9ACTN|nr:ATP-binding protein [Gordonia iterans]AVL99283.1 ATP-binding protein [Gordonia iterans]